MDGGRRGLGDYPAAARPDPGGRVREDEADALVEVLRTQGERHDDPSEPPAVRSSDPGDEYLLVLTAVSRAVLISGDRHLLVLADDLPVHAPAAFLASIEPG